MLYQSYSISRHESDGTCSTSLLVLIMKVMFHQCFSACFEGGGSVPQDCQYSWSVSENVTDAQLTKNLMKYKPSGKGEGEGLIVTTCTTGFSLFCVILAVDISVQLSGFNAFVLGLDVCIFNLTVFQTVFFTGSVFLHVLIPLDSCLSLWTPYPTHNDFLIWNFKFIWSLPNIYLLHKSAISNLCSSKKKM